MSDLYSHQLKDLHKQISIGDYAQAFETLEALLQKSEGSWALLNLAGLCCFGLNEVRKALEFFQHAERLEANRYCTVSAISSCYLRLGRVADGLFYHKMRLTLEKAERDLPFLLPFIDFHLNLGFMVDNYSLIEGKRSLKDGQYLRAYEELENFSEVRDPSPELLEYLIRLSLFLGRHHHALQWASLYHQEFAEQSNSRLLALQAVAVIDDPEALENLITECEQIADYRLQAGLIEILQRLGYDDKTTRSKRIDEWWRNIPKPSENLQNYARTRALSQACVGIFVGNLSMRSPALWFMRLLEIFGQLNMTITVYCEDADIWCRHLLETQFSHVVDIAEVDSETLSCIIIRNQHDVLLSLAEFSQYAHFAVCAQLPTPIVGLVPDIEHLRQPKRAGLDRIITNDHLCTSLDERIFSLKQYTFLPSLSGARWAWQQQEEFVIALALLPHQVAAAIPCLISLLLMNKRIMLQVDETLLGDYGVERLLKALQGSRVQNAEERIFAHAQEKFIDNDEFIRHLLVCDLYLSTGVTGYDYTALQCGMPIVLMPDVPLADHGYSREILAHLDIAEMHPANREQLENTLKHWFAEPDEWEGWTLEYLQQLEAKSDPVSQFQQLLDFNQQVLKVS